MIRFPDVLHTVMRKICLNAKFGCRSNRLVLSMMLDHTILYEFILTVFYAVVNGFNNDFTFLYKLFYFRFWINLNARSVEMVSDRKIQTPRMILEAWILGKIFKFNKVYPNVSYSFGRRIDLKCLLCDL